MAASPLMDELMTWLRQQLDDDERVALEASRRDEDGSTPTGEHWHWVEPKHDQVLTLDPMLDEYLNDCGPASLRSVEEYPTGSVGPLPHFVVSYAEEQRTVDAMHIARWDPARVLAEVDAKRRILDEAVVDANGLDMSVDLDRRVGTRDESTEPYLGDKLVRLLALPYDDRPGYREEWRPS